MEYFPPKSQNLKIARPSNISRSPNLTVFNSVSYHLERPKEFPVEEHEMPKLLSVKRKRKSKDSEHSPPNITPKPISNSFIPLSEPSAFKPCPTQPHLIRPKILVPCCPVSAPQRHQMPYFPVPRSRGIVIGKKSPNIVKVPRDENSKLIVYDPHNKSKSKDKVKPLSSVKPYNKNGSGSKSPKSLSESQTTSKNRPKSASPVLDYRKRQSPTSEVTNSADVKIEKVKSTKKIDDWSTQDVYEYIRNSDCEKYADIFLEQVANLTFTILVFVRVFDRIEYLYEYFSRPFVLLKLNVKFVGQLLFRKQKSRDLRSGVFRTLSNI